MDDVMRVRLQAALGEGVELGSRLSDAGMSDVFLVHDRATGRRLVAKAIDPTDAKPGRAERFAKEIRVLSVLRHPRIVSLIDHGSADRLLYYTMEYAGESLRAKLDRERRLPASEAATIMRDVAEGLSYLHLRRTIHRDIKPGNILCGDTGAIITDLGITKSAIGVQAITREGQGVGTFDYMSPEQLTGVRVTGRADVYSLGIVVYEMLTGRTRKDQPPKATLDEVYTYRPDIPESFAQLIVDCLEESVDRRPTSDEVLERLGGSSGSLLDRAMIVVKDRARDLLPGS